MIKVLQIGMCDKLGGIETFVINLYRNIDKEKFQFDFIDMTEKGICYQDEIKSMGGKIFKVTPRGKSSSDNKKELEKIIKENNYDAIHFHLNTWSYITPILIAQKLDNIKIIVHSHNEWKGKSIKTKILDKINRSRVKKDKIIKLACSDVAGKWIFGKDEFKIIDNGIDLEKFRFSKEKRDKIRKELSIPEDSIILGHVGAFRYQKNHEFLIDIFNEYLKNNLKSYLLMGGEGELKPQIEEKVKNLGIENNVKFLGLRNDVDYLYSAFDYFVFPSFFEGLPISVVEAQASGVNCLISKEITDEVVLNENVIKLDIKSDVKDWTSRINDSITIDREKILNSKLNRYSIKATATSVEKIYIGEK